MKGKKSEWKPDGYIFAALRKIWRWSPERSKILYRALTNKKWYTCFICEKKFDRKEVAVDHKIPVIDPHTGFQGWDTYIKRLFCSSDNLQVICKVDHSTKTKQENALRRQFKKESK